MDTKDIITVTPIAETNVPPTILGKHAARTCYSADVPELDADVNEKNTSFVKNTLFNTGHHTTLEHNYFTFNIEGIPVSSLVFGLHLTAPFYDTDQRSGRFSKMYENANTNEIKRMLETYYPNVSPHNIDQACSWIAQGLNLYADNNARITELARDAIHRERPKANDEYVEKQAPKLAQEQLRMFISMIAPTALDWTADLVTIAALYRTAWTPFMRDTMDKIANGITEKHPDISYIFDVERNNNDWNPKFPKDYAGVKTKPGFELLDYKYNDKAFVSDNSRDMVDTLQFRPETMNNSMGYVHSRIHVDAGATMGQDQRHRSIRRSEPVFTGFFYLPPLLNAAGLKDSADKFMRDYYNILSNPMVPRGMMMSIAPYGAMVQYEKRADLNALMHEQGKRTCWCAQEAIYHISCDLRRDLGQYIGQNAQLMQYMTPPCLSRGHCPEGARCCGRSIVDAKLKGFFTERQI